jgi:hypothetical protein
MPAPKDLSPPTASSSSSSGGNAVERSLEDFIARANTTLAPVSPEVAPQVRAIGTRRGKAKKPPATLVVLGPRGPLAEETEIVTRLAPEDLLPRRKPWFSLRLGLAFVAGAAAVLLATQLISGGGPKPVKPTVPAVVAVPTPTPLPPPIIVQPIPAEELPAPAPAAPEPAPAPVVETAATEKPRARRPRPSVTAKAPKSTAKKPTGLVDPFAN